MLPRDLFCVKLCLALDGLLDADHQLLQLVFGFERLNLELFSALWLYSVDVHCLVDVAQVIAEIFFVEELSLNFLEAFIKPDKIIDVVYLLSESGGLFIEPGVEGVGVFFDVGGNFLFESFAQVFHVVDDLVFDFVEAEGENAEIDWVGDFELEFLCVLGHVGEIELDGLGVILDIGIGDELVDVSLSILPVDVQGLGGEVDDFFGQFVLGCLDHLLYSAHVGLEILDDWDGVQVVALGDLPVLAHNIIPLLQDIDILLHFSMLGPPLKILQRTHTLLDQKAHLIKHIIQRRLQAHPQLANVLHVLAAGYPQELLLYDQFVAALLLGGLLSYMVQWVEYLPCALYLHADVEHFHRHLGQVVLADLARTEYRLDVEYLPLVCVLALLWRRVWVVRLYLALHLQCVQLSD